MQFGEFADVVGHDRLAGLRPQGGVVGDTGHPLQQQAGAIGRFGDQLRREDRRRRQCAVHAGLSIESDLRPGQRRVGQAQPRDELVAVPETRDERRSAVARGDPVQGDDALARRLLHERRDPVLIHGQSKSTRPRWFARRADPHSPG